MTLLQSIQNEIRDTLPEFIDDDNLDSYVPESEWNVDSSQISADDLMQEEARIIPIQGVLQAHPEGVLRTSSVTPVKPVLSGEEE